MLEEKLNLENIPHFKQGELERRMDDVLQLIDEGHSPVMIHDRNDRRFLMFSWDDFFNRFGWLYSKEETEWWRKHIPGNGVWCHIGRKRPNSAVCQ